MITESEAQARAEFMGLVHRQLEILRSRKLAPAQVAQLIRGSSLRLVDIEWVREIIDEAARLDRMREALDKLVMYYEGYFEALARVLEVKPEVLRQTFDPDKVHRIEAEMLKIPG